MLLLSMFTGLLLYDKIMAHTHVSRLPTPSQSDLAINQRVLLLDGKCSQVVAEGLVQETWSGRASRRKIYGRDVMYNKVPTACPISCSGAGSKIIMRMCLSTMLYVD